MKFVATKTADQLDLQALHRVRERLVGQRTGIINQIRAFLLERGVAVRQGLRFLRAELPTILATRCEELSPRMGRLIEDLAGDWRRLDERIEGLTGEIEAVARRDAGCERLMSVPAFGSIISSAPRRLAAAPQAGPSTTAPRPASIARGPAGALPAALSTRAGRVPSLGRKCRQPPGCGHALGEQPGLRPAAERQQRRPVAAADLRHSAEEAAVLRHVPNDLAVGRRNAGESEIAVGHRAILSHSSGHSRRPPRMLPSPGGGI
jgi:hypothetical protein